jgi:hypothetical protein
MQALTTLIKLPGEDRVFAFDFSQQPEMVAGQTIISATVTGSPNLAGDITFGTVVIAAGLVQFPVLSGNPATQYLVTCLATTSSGAIMEGLGKLYVPDPTKL